MDEQKNHYCAIEQFDGVETHEYIENIEQKFGMFGSAIGSCYEKDGYLWVSNDEYSNTVNFCPFCGYESKKPVFKKIEKI